MDNIQKIAISKIADILSSSNLIIPQIDIWRKIFNNAGLSDLYENRLPQFTTRVEPYGYNPNEKITTITKNAITAYMILSMNCYMIKKHYLNFLKV